jgi:hypothetical protein
LAFLVENEQSKVASPSAFLTLERRKNGDTFMKRYLLAAGLSFCLSPAALADANSSDIEQIGNGNTAEVDQTVNEYPFGKHLDEGVSRISQTGTGNVAGVKQDNGTGRLLTSEIVQIGSGNRAEVVQDPEVGDFGSMVRQDGPNNRTKVTQTGIATTVSSALDQRGAGHEAVVSQQAFGSAFDAMPALISDIRQIGQANKAEVDQWGHFNRSTIQQDGTNQITNVFQQGFLAVHDSVITQSGMDNVANVEQTGVTDQFHASEIHVTGDGNETNVAQGYTREFAFIWHDSVITVTGDANHATVRQGGHSEMNTSDVTVIGDENRVLVDQFTDHGLNESQIQLDGGHNQVAVQQSLPDFIDPQATNTSVITGAGNGNVIQVTQH